jgi:putative acetyltransferase
VPDFASTLETALPDRRQVRVRRFERMRGLPSLFEIRLDDPDAPDVRALLDEHLAEMHRLSPPESVHALDVATLRLPDVTFWTARLERELLGCGALKELDATHGEIKSMRTAALHRRKGVARAIVEHIVAEARRRRYRRLSLETGSLPAFTPARKLYERLGFAYCSPFANYVEDPNSVFLTRMLEGPHEKCAAT